MYQEYEDIFCNDWLKMAGESLLSASDMLLSMLLQFIVYFAPGYLLLERQLKSLSFVIKLPLYFSVGMLVVTIILSLIGIFYFWEYSLFVIGTVSYIIILIRFLFFGGGERPIGRLVATVRSQLYPSPIISFIVFSFVISIFAHISGYLKWPVPGDATVHGFLTNLLINNHALQTTLAPVAPSLLWDSPFGFHVIAANLSLAFDIFPGASIFVFATTIIALILMLVYSVTYILTRSVIFSLLALMSGFYVSSISNLEYWLIGYYYNGPYPSLFGYLILLVYLAVQLTVPFADGKRTANYWILSLISLVGMVIIYPPLVLLPAIHFVATNIFRNRYRLRKAIFNAVDRSRQKRQLHNFATSNLTIGYLIKKLKRSSTTYALFGVAAVVMVVAAYGFLTYWNSDIISSSFFWQISDNIFRMISRVDQASSQYGLNPGELFASDLDAPLTFLTMIVAAISIVKGKFAYLGGTYLLFSSLLLLSIWDVTANYFWFILPRRLFVFLIIFNWITILTYARVFSSSLVQRLGTTTFFKNKQSLILGKQSLMSYAIYVLIAVPPAVLFLPDVFSNAELEQADKWVGWFSRSKTFGNDYGMIEWISENTDSKDLIMVQNSRTSAFIYSFALKNLTSTILGIPETHYKVQRSFDNQIAWNRPELLEQFVNEYDVKYVLLLTAPSSWGYSNQAVLGGDRLQHSQKYGIQSYDNIFTNMSFLETVKKFGTSTLYEMVSKPDH
jgi:hypothetical protein